MLIKKFKMMKINNNYKYISAFFLLTLSLFLVSCEEEINDESFISNDFVSFSFDQDVDVNIGETIAVGVDVYASSANSADRTIGLYVDDSSTASAGFSVPSSVTIPAGATQVSFDVTITGGSFSSTESIVVGMTAAEGLDIPTSVDDNGNVVHKPHTINVTDVCPGTTVYLDITFDNYPDETGWQITSNGSVLDQGGLVAGAPYPAGRFDITGYSGDPLSLNWCLSSGSYTFIIYDYYYDGICCSYGSGSYSLTTEDGTVLASGGSFGFSEETAFTL